MARGTWQGSGTWETTSGGGSLAVAAVLAILGAPALEVIAALLWWIVAATAVLLVAAAVTAAWLIRRGGLLRGEAPWQQGSLIRVHVREPLARPQDAAAGRVAPPQPRPALDAPAQHVHFHFDPADTEALGVIRAALPGQPGDITERT